MGFDSMFSSLGISGSGLSAEQVRMKAIAENIANANTTRTPEGGPYRRNCVIFSSVLRETMQGGSVPAGVRVAGVNKSAAPPMQVFNPDHPDADASGHVAMPDISMSNEMIDMIAASRSYEANLAAIKNFKSMVSKAISILR
ncbi:MAG TPA: flagellar basal body rod protein FlgC [Planctomycetota bacterium]|nr:flagellar basal body rod protein FlgC [Planctomycetota bacterium]